MSDLKVKKLISFNKDTVYLNYLTESNSVNPLEILDVEFSRSNEVVGKDLSYPVKINVINNSSILNSINYTNYNFIKDISGSNKVCRSGYILIMYDTKSKGYSINQRFWYNDSLPSTSFNDPNYIFTNPLNFLESDINKNLENGDVIFVILLGSSLDFINGTNKYMVNEDNVLQRKLIPIRANNTINPIDFLKTTYNSSLNTNKITMDSYKNKDVDGNTLSFPKSYFFNYMCKIDTNKKIITDEYISYNNRRSTNEKIRYQSNFSLGDVNNLSTPSNPFTNNYPFSKEENEALNAGQKVLMGLNINYQFNIFNEVKSNIPIDTILVKGVEFKSYNLLNVGNVSDGKGNFQFNKDVIISETKKE